ncbi:hypothetical protein [Aureimonas populi]|uniref:Chromosome partition protein Smc n=1 Tax=Aureimonas populi TaxID=1701758 RepID=A0ABW5CFZ0_9HYPH|nr:hypothetical protein [Aureimonas populi]
MIATGLVFLLGALVAILFCLLFVPILWRNAQRLARRDFVATMPATMNELRAEVDRVRAEAAMTVRRHEMAAHEAREKAALERAKVGRLTASHAEMKHFREQFEADANALRGELSSLRERSEALSETVAALEADNAEMKAQITERALEIDTLLARIDELETERDELSVELSASRTRVAALSSAASPSMEGALPVAQGEQQDADIRERLAEIAAHVIHRTAVEEGDGSPLAAMVAGEAPERKERGAPRSLAERVRELAAADTARPSSGNTPASPTGPGASDAKKRGGGRSRRNGRR